MTLIRSNYLGHISHSVDQVPTNLRAGTQLEDKFEGRVQSSNTGMRQMLEKIGIVGVCNGKIQSLSLEQVEKIRHFALRSDTPLFFIMDLKDGGEIAGASSYAEKSKWLAALKDRNLGNLPLSILGAESDRQSQLNFLSDLLGAVRTGL